MKKWAALVLMAAMVLCAVCAMAETVLTTKNVVVTLSANAATWNGKDQTPAVTV